jgi:hypothetical protein
LLKIRETCVKPERISRVLAVSPGSWSRFDSVWHSTAARGFEQLPNWVAVPRNMLNLHPGGPPRKNQARLGLCRPKSQLAERRKELKHGGEALVLCGVLHGSVRGCTIYFFKEDAYKRNCVYATEKPSESQFCSELGNKILKRVW